MLILLLVTSERMLVVSCEPASLDPLQVPSICGPHQGQREEHMPVGGGE